MMLDFHKIHPRMDVVSSDNQRLGVVSKVAGEVLLLRSATRQGWPPPAVPRTWITEVDGVVRLAKPGSALREILA